MKQSKLLFAAVTLVVALFLTSQISIVSAAPAYQDEFTSSSLQSFWTFVNPAGGGSYSLTANSGYLQITSPTGVGLSKTSNFNAPRVMQPVTGDFVVTTSVSGTFSQAGFRAGLLVYKNNDNYMRFEKYGTNQVLMYGYLNGAETYQTLSLPSSINPLYLKIEKTGSTITSYWSQNGISWTQVKQYTNFNTVDPLEVGLFVINVGTVSFSADFDYFHVTPSNFSVLPESPLGAIVLPVAVIAAFAVYRLKPLSGKFRRLN